MSLLHFRTILGGVLLTALAACDESDPRFSGGDASVPAADSTTIDPTTMRVSSLMLLEDLTSNGLTLLPSEVSTIRLVVRDEYGEEVVGARVEVALLGQAMNATASTLVDYSSEEGEVSFYVQAGTEPTSFQLRLTAGLIETYIPINVVRPESSAVELQLETSAVVSSVVVRAYVNRRCDEVGAALPASFSLSLLDATVATTTLYKGASYAITALITTADGRTQSSCVDQVTSDDPIVTLSFNP